MYAFLNHETTMINDLLNAVSLGNLLPDSNITLSFFHFRYFLTFPISNEFPIFQVFLNISNVVFFYISKVFYLHSNFF